MRDRREDIEPNLRYELDQFATRNGTRVTFNKEASAKFLDFATGPRGAWLANFRDLNAAVTRMATLAAGGRISAELVEAEIARLTAQWGQGDRDAPTIDVLSAHLTDDALTQIDRFDRARQTRGGDSRLQERHIAFGSRADALRCFANEEGILKRRGPAAEVPGEVRIKIGQA